MSALSRWRRNEHSQDQRHDRLSRECYQKPFLDSQGSIRVICFPYAIWEIWRIWGIGVWGFSHSTCSTLLTVPLRAYLQTMSGVYCTLNEYVRSPKSTRDQIFQEVLRGQLH